VVEVEGRSMWKKNGKGNKVSAVLLFESTVERLHHRTELMVRKKIFLYFSDVN